MFLKKKPHLRKPPLSPIQELITLHWQSDLLSQHESNLLIGNFNSALIDIVTKQDAEQSINTLYDQCLSISGKYSHNSNNPPYQWCQILEVQNRFNATETNNGYNSKKLTLDKWEVPVSLFYISMQEKRLQQSESTQLNIIRMDEPKVFEMVITSFYEKPRYTTLYGARPEPIKVILNKQTAGLTMDSGYYHISDSQIPLTELKKDLLRLLSSGQQIGNRVPYSDYSGGQTGDGSGYTNIPMLPIN